MALKASRALIFSVFWMGTRLSRSTTSLHTRSHSAASGTVLIEFSIMLLFLVSFVSATFDFGWAFRQQNVLFSCVRNGARSAAKLWQPDYTCNGLTTVAQQTTLACLLANGLAAATVPSPIIERINVGTTQIRFVTVTALQPAECFLCMFLQGSTTLSGTSRFRLEDTSFAC